jgi:hypothetical protein
MKKLLLSATILLTGCGAAPVAMPVVSDWASLLSPDFVAISTDAALPQGPSLAKVGNTFFVAYETHLRANQNICLATSSDATHWSAPQKLFSGQAPALFAIGQNPAIAFESGNNISIATRNGDSWKVAKTEGLSAGALNPSVTPLKEGGIAIAYDLMMGGGCEVAESKDGIHFTKKQLVCENGYSPSIAQKEDGTIVVAYTDENGISEVSEENDVWGEPEAQTNDSSDLAPCLAKSGDDVVLTYSKKVDGRRAIAQVIDGQEKILIANQAHNLDPSVLFLGDEQYVALGIKRMDGGQGVFLKLSSR